LTIEINRGGADIEVVLSDILGLTKLKFQFQHGRKTKVAARARLRGY
jgi:hypothetical protein